MSHPLDGYFDCACCGTTDMRTVYVECESCGSTNTETLQECEEANGLPAVVCQACKYIKPVQIFCDACVLCECGEDSPSCKEILVDGASGIYVPQDFANRYLSDKADREAWGVSLEDYQVLMAGPEHDEYWETWSAIEGRVERDWNGKAWVLQQDGDLWAQCVGPALLKVESKAND